MARQADIEQLDDPAEALEQWLRAMEDYFSAYSGLPEPLMAAARAQEPDSPLTIPCDILISATDEYVRAAQLAGRVRASVRGHDLFLAACSVAWIKGTGTEGSRSTGCARSSRAATASRAPRRKRQSPALP